MSWAFSLSTSPNNQTLSVNSALERLVHSAVHEVLSSKAQLLRKFSESISLSTTNEDDSWPYFPGNVADFFEYFDSESSIIRYPITQDDITWIKKSIQTKLSGYPELIRTGVALDNGVLPRVLQTYLGEAFGGVNITDKNWVYFVEIDISRNLKLLQWKINESFIRVLDRTLVNYLEQLVWLFREYETKLAEAIESDWEIPQLQGFWKNWWGKSTAVVDVYWDQDFILVE